MTLKKEFWLKVSGICGILSPILTLFFIALAINSYRFFDWEINALSDLGIISGITSVLFNNGLIIGGFLILFFIPGLYFLLSKTIFSFFSLSIFALACCFLIVIGLFPENIVPIHYLVSVGFFICLPISLFLVSGSFYLIKKKFWVLFSLLFAFLVTIPWIIYFSTEIFKAIAIPEIISGFGISIWVITLGFKMLNEIKKHKKTI